MLSAASRAFKALARGVHGIVENGVHQLSIFSNFP